MLCQKCDLFRFPPAAAAAPQNLTYSLHEAGGGNDWWNQFHPACGTSIDSWHTSRQM